ncbi:MAG TPA: hypothetical protein IAA29_19790 [Candidatus Paenibacillus intestinavium]|nr:hypothetical protein [Candidatus Paenibacillus intestinavium]
MRYWADLAAQGGVVTPEEVATFISFFINDPEATKTEPFNISYNLPGNAEFEKMGKTAIQEIGFGRKTVVEAVESFYTNAQQIIANNITQ